MILAVIVPLKEVNGASWLVKVICVLMPAAILAVEKMKGASLQVKVIFALKNLNFGFGLMTLFFALIRVTIFLLGVVNDAFLWMMVTYAPDYDIVDA